VFIDVGGVLGVQGRFRCCFRGVLKACRLDGGFGWGEGGSVDEGR